MPSSVLLKTLVLDVRFDALFTHGVTRFDPVDACMSHPRQTLHVDRKIPLSVRGIVRKGPLRVDTASIASIFGDRIELVRGQTCSRDGGAMRFYLGTGGSCTSVKL